MVPVAAAGVDIWLEKLCYFSKSCAHDFVFPFLHKIERAQVITLSGRDMRCILMCAEVMSTFLAKLCEIKVKTLK